MKTTKTMKSKTEAYLSDFWYGVCIFGGLFFFAAGVLVMGLAVLFLPL